MNFRIDIGKLQVSLQVSIVQRTTEQGTSLYRWQAPLSTGSLEAIFPLEMAIKTGHCLF
jgi:hypothetical protein